MHDRCESTAVVEWCGAQATEFTAVAPPSGTAYAGIEPAAPTVPGAGTTTTPDYVLIAGMGRSGTNWLASLFDLSPATHVRNEPNSVPGSPFGLLPSGLHAPQDAAAFGIGWDQTIDWVGVRQGERDPMIRARKDHLYTPARWMGAAWLIHKARARRSMALAIPELARPEWRLPRWLGNRSRLRRALGVYKIGACPGWIAWVLSRRPRVRVIHIARHPGGFLHSWRTRFLQRCDPECVKRDNAARLCAVATADPAWASRFGDIAGMRVEESELWFWSYVHGMIAAAGAGSDSYERVIYENLARHPVPLMSGIYGRCGLAWSRAIERAVQRESADSMAIANRWRTQLTGDEVAIVERVLAASPARAWWESRDPVALRHSEVTNALAA